MKQPTLYKLNSVVLNAIYKKLDTFNKENEFAGQTELMKRACSSAGFGSWTTFYQKLQQGRNIHRFTARRLAKFAGLTLEDFTKVNKGGE